MVKKNLKVIISPFLIGILLAISASVAFAASASSPWGYYGPFLGYSYKNQATVSNDGGLMASTTVANQVSASVPTGYMGAKARLYNSSGTLVASSDYFYNSSPVTSLNVTKSGSGTGSFYSYGITAAYNGNGYNYYYTFQSPNINN